MAQQYEIEAWLGNDHGLTGEQVKDLTWLADEIATRYPDPDDQLERDAALMTAYRLMREEEGVVDELAHDLADARAAEARALAGIRQAALILIPGKAKEATFARQAGVDRMAVRGWLGKR